MPNSERDTAAIVLFLLARAPVIVRTTTFSCVFTVVAGGELLKNAFGGFIIEDSAIYLVIDR
jgi:hypothetical protein